MKMFVNGTEVGDIQADHERLKLGDLLVRMLFLILVHKTENELYFIIGGDKQIGLRIQDIYDSLTAEHGDA